MLADQGMQARGGAGTNMGLPPAPSAHRAMMMTACDLSAITKPWEVQSKVRGHVGLFRGRGGGRDNRLC